MTNKLLTAIDGASGKVPDVVFIAATNLPDTLDAAAVRGGRFTEKVEFTLPDQPTIEAFVREWMAGTRAKLDPTFEPTAAARLMLGQSIANVREILQQAVNNMIGRRTNGNRAVTVSLADVARAARGMQI